MQVYFQETDTTEDTQLIDAALQGSKTALEQLLKRHYGFIYNVALRFVLSPQDAEDLTQEVLIKVITKLATFKQTAQFRTWLYQIVFRHFLSGKKRPMEQAIVSFGQYGESLDDIPLESMSPEEELAQAESIQDAKIGCMTGMLICLDRQQRLVYILGEIFELDSKAAAELLDIRADNFRKQLSRARKDLYHFMQSKCGLINKDNPCRCPKKTKGFIAAGWVQPEQLQFYQGFRQSIAALVPEKVTACDTLLEEKYGMLFKEHPYYDKNQAAELVQSLSSDIQLKQLFNL